MAVGADADPVLVAKLRDQGAESPTRLEVEFDCDAPVVETGHEAAIIGKESCRAKSAPDEAPAQSEIRLVAAKPASGTPPTSAAHEAMERTIVKAKRSLKDGQDRPPPAARVALVDEAEARKAAAAALRSGRAITTFEPFGRDVERRYFLLTARAGFTTGTDSAVSSAR